MKLKNSPLTTSHRQTARGSRRIFAAGAALLLAATAACGGSDDQASSDGADATDSGSPSEDVRGPQEVTLTLGSTTYSFVDSDGEGNLRFCKPFFGETLQGSLVLDADEAEDAAGTDYSINFFFLAEGASAAAQADGNDPQINVWLPGERFADAYTAGEDSQGDLALKTAGFDSAAPINLTATLSDSGGSVAGPVTFTRLSDGTRVEGSIKVTC